MLNSEKIKKRMAELKLSCKKLACLSGMSESTVKALINNRREANTMTVECLINALQPSESELNEYFFYDGVAICATNCKPLKKNF